jgi:capsular polysaccharide biosynthesis protein
MTEEPKLPEGQTLQSPYVLIPAYDQQGEKDDQIDLVGFIEVLWRRKLLVLLVPLLFGLTAFVFTLRTPSMYSARATLVFRPPQVPASLNPEPLSLDSLNLKLIIESDLIAGRLTSELLQKKVVEPDTSIEQIQAMLSVELLSEFDSRMDLVVEMGSPEKVMTIANTWAQLSVVESESQSQSRLQASLRLVESQYQMTRKKLTDLELERKEQRDHSVHALLELEKSWSTRILDFSSETERLQNEYEKETQRLQLQFADQWKLDVLREELRIRKAKLAQYGNDVMDTEFTIKTKKDALTQIAEQAQSQPQYLVLSKALTDDALWEQLKGSEAGLPEELNQIKLRSEVLNPAYQSLLEQLTATQIEYDTLIPKKDHLRNEVESLHKAIDELQSFLTTKEVERFALHKNRETEMNNLQVKHRIQREVLDKARASERYLLGHERDLRVTELTRGIAGMSSFFQPIAEKNREVQLDRSDEEPFVKIGVLAVESRRLMARRTTWDSLIALAVGFILSVMLAFAFEYAQSIKVNDFPERQIKVSRSRSLGLESDSPTATRR